MKVSKHDVHIKFHDNLSFGPKVTRNTNIAGLPVLRKEIRLTVMKGCVTALCNI
jgi:hypothetical protein